MSYGIRITGLKEAQRTLGVDLKPTLRSATKAIALEVQGEIAPYPPATIANSPSNPSGRWYERGYGQKWRTKAGIRGRKTSQTLGQRWAIKASGAIGWIVGNAASYARKVHAEGEQARFHGARGWVTDKTAVHRVLSSGVVGRILTQAIMARMRRGR